MVNQSVGNGRMTGIIEKIPQNILPPALLQFKKTKHTKDITKLVDNVFKDHYGETEEIL